MYDSQLVHPDDVKDVLGVDKSSSKIQPTGGKSRKKRNAQILGELAEKIPGSAIEQIALKHLKVSFTQMDTKKTETSKDGVWWLNFCILDDYMKKQDSSIEVNYIFLQLQ